MADALPPRLEAIASRAGNGEPTWGADRIDEAAEWLLAHGRTIIGGEVYEVIGEVHWGTYRSEWATEPAGPDEPWSAYTARTLAQVRSAVACAPDRGARCRFYLATLDR